MVVICETNRGKGNSEIIVIEFVNIQLNSSRVASTKPIRTDYVDATVNKFHTVSKIIIVIKLTIKKKIMLKCSPNLERAYVG